MYSPFPVFSLQEDGRSPASVLMPIACVFAGLSQLLGLLRYWGGVKCRTPVRDAALHWSVPCCAFVGCVLAFTGVMLFRSSRIEDLVCFAYFDLPDSGTLYPEPRCSYGRAYGAALAGGIISALYFVVLLTLLRTGDVHVLAAADAPSVQEGGKAPLPSSTVNPLYPQAHNVGVSHVYGQSEGYDVGTGAHATPAGYGGGVYGDEEAGYGEEVYDGDAGHVEYSDEYENEYEYDDGGGYEEEYDEEAGGEGAYDEYGGAQEY